MTQTTTPSAAIARLIAVFFLTERTDDHDDRPHADLWSGSGVAPSLRFETEGLWRVHDQLVDAVEVDEWGDYPYRAVWRIDSERAIVTHCEGDVFVLVARSPADYEACLRSADAFYREH